MKVAAGIYGAGGHARVVSSIIKARGFDIIGFFDDSFIGKETIQGISVLGRFEEILNYRDNISSVYLAIGNNIIRKKAFDYLSERGFRLPSLIHPTALIERDVTIDNASVVSMGTILGTEVHIGSGTIVNTGCSVDHESSVGEFSHLAPKVVIAGRTKIGSNTFVGMNSCIGDKLKIGDNVTIGAGSIILKDVCDGQKIMGVYA